MTANTKWLPLLLAALAACGDDGLSSVQQPPSADALRIVGGTTDLRTSAPAASLAGRIEQLGTTGPQLAAAALSDGSTAESPDVAPYILHATTETYLNASSARAKAYMQYYAMGAAQSVTVATYKDGVPLGATSPATSQRDLLWDLTLRELTTYTPYLPVASACGHSAAGAGSHSAYSLVPNLSLEMQQIDKVMQASGSRAYQPACEPEPPTTEPTAPSGDDGGTVEKTTGYEVCIYYVTWNEWGEITSSTLLGCTSL